MEKYGLMHYMEKQISNIEEKANLIRRDVIEIIFRAKVGCIGSSLSIVDIMAVLYFHILKIDVNNPDWEERDRVILSKGHASAAWYAALAEKGFFPKKELLTFNNFDSRLQMYPDMRKTPGVDMSCGPLGQGISIATGIALGARYLKMSYRVFVIVGDGEMQEGQIWEAALAASHYKLDNLIVILDYNKLQFSGQTNVIMNIEPIVKKWQSFGWNAIEINGHRVNSIMKALEEAIKIEGKPTIVIAHTIKGKGISFIENKFLENSLPLSSKQRIQALSELKCSNISEENF